MAAHEIEEAAGVVANLLAGLGEGDELRFTLAHRDLLAAAKQAHELNEVHLEAIAGLAHRDESGAYPRNVTMVVRTEHVDEPGKSQLALFEVIGDVRGEVGLLTVFAYDHAVLLVAELRGPEPGGSLLLVEAPLAFELRERAVNRPAVAQRPL